MSEDWDLADLRERLGASAPTWRRWQDFKRRVLEPACARSTSLRGSASPGSRSSTGARLWACGSRPGRKGATEIAEADAELARHRAGRKERRGDLVERIVEERTSWSREAEAKLAEPADRQAEEPPAAPSADPRQIDLEEAIAVAGVRLTAAQLMLGAEAARAEGAAQFDVQAAYAGLAAGGAQRKDRLRNPAGTGSTSASGARRN